MNLLKGKRGGLVVLLLIAGLGAGVTMMSHDRSDNSFVRSRYDAIRASLTLEEVQAIFGSTAEATSHRKGERHFRPVTRASWLPEPMEPEEFWKLYRWQVWYGNSACVEVLFDRNDQVVGKGYWELVTDPGLFDRFRKWLGW